ncbi:MAG: RNA polymerase sigma factor [Candidatus Cyclobacteriaceae bacterium M3_2C_046]
MKHQIPAQKPEISHLIEQHRKLIYKVVNSYCADIEEQEDLIQEIIYQVLKGYEKFDHRVKVTTWLYKVAFNVSISHYRKLKIRKKYMTPLSEKIVRVEEPDQDQPGHQLQLLRKFIEELDPLNKAILIMYLDENSHQEISAAMGISVSNVGTKINRIKKQLKQKFN